MQTGHAFTTPFGRRPLSLGMLATQANASEIDPELSVDKWKLLRGVSEAREKLGISDRALVVLNALLTFYPQTELAEANGLVVFPSNAQLSQRAYGMAPATLRRHLNALVEAGLIFRKDSPNGKRFSRKARFSAGDGAGEGADGREAFGFNISPLIARACKIEALAQQVREERYQLKMLKERVSLLRRDIDKLIELGSETLPDVDWQTKYALFRATVDALPRQASCEDLELAADGLECLHLEISKLLENKLNSQNMSANESHNERHKQNSKTQSTSDLEPRFRTKQGGPDADNTGPIERVAAGGGESDGRRGGDIPATPDLGVESGVPAEKPIPLGLVLKACPDIANYAKGEISSWRDLMAAAVTARPVFDVSPSAYQEACEVLGQERAAIVIACILQRAEHITSAGGYLRVLTEKARAGEFSLWPMLLAQLRANGGHVRLVGREGRGE
jgi:replication initiation protein RepC